MTDPLLARKGQAVPTGLTGSNRQAAIFAARRIVVFGHKENAEAAADHLLPRSFRDAYVASNVDRPPPKRPAVSLLRNFRRRRRFTFRLDDRQHELFCAAADIAGCSRQKLLERVLLNYLCTHELRADDAVTTHRPGMPPVPRLI